MRHPSKGCRQSKPRACPARSSARWTASRAAPSWGAGAAGSGSSVHRNTVWACGRGGGGGGGGRARARARAEGGKGVKGEPSRHRRQTGKSAGLAAAHTCRASLQLLCSKQKRHPTAQHPQSSHRYHDARRLHFVHHSACSAVPAAGRRPGQAVQHAQPLAGGALEGAHSGALEDGGGGDAHAVHRQQRTRRGAQLRQRLAHPDLERRGQLPRAQPHALPRAQQAGAGENFRHGLARRLCGGKGGRRLGR